MTYILYYLLVINVITAIIYCVSAVRESRGEQPISDRILFTFGIAGGALGAYYSMRLKKMKENSIIFRLGIPAAFIVECIIAEVVTVL